MNCTKPKTRGAAGQRATDHHDLEGTKMSKHVKLQEGGTISIPKILVDYLECLDLMKNEPFTKQELLWWAGQASFDTITYRVFKYHENAKNALLKFKRELESEGIKSEVVDHYVFQFCTDEEMEARGWHRDESHKCGRLDDTELLVRVNESSKEKEENKHCRVVRKSDGEVVAEYHR